MGDTADLGGEADLIVRRWRSGENANPPAASPSPGDPSLDQDAGDLDEILSKRLGLLTRLAPLIVVFNCLDWLSYPEFALRWLGYRAVTAASLALVIQPLLRRGFRTNPFVELVVFALVVSVCLARIAFESGGFKSESYVLFVLTCWAFAMICPLGMRRSAVLALAVLVPYSVAGLIVGAPRSALIAFHQMVLLGALMFSLLGGHLSTTLYLAQRRAERNADRLIRALEESVRRDPLTGVRNRKALEEQIEAELVRLSRAKGGFCLLIADLDHFKAVNDRFGHPVGDKVLIRFCRTVESVLRAHDGLFRLGGEEFALLLSDADRGQGSVAGDRIRSAVEAMRIEVAGERLQITVSIGLAEARPGDQTELLLERADEALYRAKASGRNQIASEA